MSDARILSRGPLPRALLQIVPKFPGGVDGVGDYALNLARGLRRQFGVDSIFAAFDQSPPAAPVEFENVALPLASGLCPDAAILHYVNYGYDPRGVPARLPQILRDLSVKIDGKVVVVFHELYASEPPWRRAFWSQWRQKKIAQEIAAMADAYLVSNPIAAEQLREFGGEQVIIVQPTPSNFGEPQINVAQIAGRNPQRWLICGGTVLLERSLRSLASRIVRIPSELRPRELFLLGGVRNLRITLLAQHLTNITVNYIPEITPEEASRIIGTCSYGWIDYFRGRRRQSGAILKSGSFAALCAHAVVPVFPHANERIVLEGDALPELSFVSRNEKRVAKANERSTVAMHLYSWYHKHSSLETLTQRLAQVLGMTQGAAVAIER